MVEIIRIKKNGLGLWLVLFLLTFVLHGMGQAADPPKLPKNMIWSCYDVGSAGYTQASAISNALLKAYNVRVRMIPSGTAIGRITPVLAKKCDVGILANEVYFSSEGLGDFASREWGPQDLRVLCGAPTSIGLVATAKSGVKTMRDLKGKRVAYVPGAASINVKTEWGWLAFGGLTWDDVIKTTFPSYGAYNEALISGDVDAGQTSSGNPKMYQLETSPQGIYWIPMPPEDKEGWARVQKRLPFLYPLLETQGAGVPKEGVWMAGYRYPIFTVTADTDVDFVYNLMKSIHQTFDLYKDAHAHMPRWKVEQSAVPPIDAPFHEGAIKYLREIGVWNPEHDKWNNERIQHLGKVKALWNKTVALADEKQLNAKEFPEFWLKEREREFGF